MSQWLAEMIRHCLPSTLKVVIYHGPNRGVVTSDMLCEYDVVVTSYAIIEQEWRKVVDKRKVADR
eukprot:2903137-Rhodomonas_salina.1